MEKRLLFNPNGGFKRTTRAHKGAAFSFQSHNVCPITAQLCVKASVPVTCF